MRKGFLLAFLVTALFGGGYLYYTAQAVCPAPLAYSLGDIDKRFDLSKEEARVAISEAESIWEDATGRNLFTYEDGGKLVINFVYDDRQQFVNAEDSLKEKLDATENISDAIKDTYADLVAQYKELRAVYTKRADLYEDKLAAYNAEVEKYNSRGGAPAKVYESLSQEKHSLDKEQAALNDLSNKLNNLVTQINSVGEKGNSLINTYNRGVDAYNKQFGEPREFTQGDYTNNTIKVYTFENRIELEQVLVHELGHALSLAHVDGKDSMMYYLIGDQPADLHLSPEDLQEFNRVCGEKNLWEKVKMSLRIK